VFGEGGSVRENGGALIKHQTRQATRRADEDDYISQLLRIGSNGPAEAAGEGENACVEQDVQRQENGVGRAAHEAVEPRVLLGCDDARVSPAL